jgi:NAD(P)H-dependent flavin oxidoreductase YrpB (nitropropane dioxygenase family)
MGTRFTRLVGCRLPLQQAGMSGPTTEGLVVAVADAGALGMLALTGVPAPGVTGAIDAVAARTNGVFGVNFLVPFLDKEAVAAAAARARLVEFFFGAPDPGLVRVAHDGGALCCWQIGSVDEARAARDAGCDLIVAQGVEAGGHVRGTTALLPLLDAVLDAVDIPVIASGGIGSARTVAAVLGAGADGARVGTRFLAAEEADVHPAYLAALIGAGADDTVLTTTFSRGWPAPHRVVASSIDAVTAIDDDVVAESDFGPVVRFSPAVPTAAMRGRVDAMALYAGQSVAHVRGRQPAREIVRELVSETDAAP